jgi:rfaE bifunctional protein kinase chain/domain
MRKHLLEILDRFRSRKVLVVGDLIADEFLYGRIARVSREAPVLVLEYGNLTRVPGGAANAANNLLDLGCRASISGAVGRDEAGDDLIRLLKCKGARTRGIRRLHAYVTPVKTRILAGAPHSSPQQVVRVDRVRDRSPHDQLGWNLIRPEMDSADAVIVSDYGYGSIGPALMAPMNRLARERKIPLVVDSRFRMSEYAGVTSITPNITELETSLGISIGNDAALLRKAGQRVLRNQRLQSLLVTQGRFGMTLFEANKAPVHIPIYGTDEVADVTGAGDTVIAVFTLALACGAEPENAARLANFGGGIVVMKRGTATVTQEELRAAIQSAHDSQFVHCNL